jgi:hypothetical protein
VALLPVGLRSRESTGELRTAVRGVGSGPAEPQQERQVSVDFRWVDAQVVLVRAREGDVQGADQPQRVLVVRRVEDRVTR